MTNMLVSITSPLYGTKEHSIMYMHRKTKVKAWILCIIRFLDDYYSKFEGRAEKALPAGLDSSSQVNQELQAIQEPPAHISSRSFLLYTIQVPYRTIQYNTISYHTIPLPYRTVPYCTGQYRAVPYRTIPYLTVPYHTIMFHTMP